MSNIAEQARELAEAFSDIAGAVDGYRTQHFGELNQDQRAELEGAIQRLYDCHDRFTALAIQATIENIQDELDQITSVTRRAETALRRLQEFKKVATVAACAASLAQAIVSADYGAIPSTIQSLVQELSGTPEKPAKEA